MPFQIMPALKNSNRIIAVFMKVKEALIWRLAFSKPPPNLVESFVSPCGLLHRKITKKVVAQALITQAATKASSLDKINFQILQMI